MLMQFLRKILFPFSILYDGVTTVRNLLFDKGFLKSKGYALPIIAVGNLSVGGTGKSPMIEYLIRLLQNDYKIATLSRGYRRQSEGFILASKTSTALDLGDEPMQFYSKFPNINIAVDANRQEGISKLITQVSPDLILLDDAYQHRKVTAGFYVLLTKYTDLYTDDLLLPAGNLRESKRGAKRAHAIIVTKCPEILSDIEKDKILEKINPQPHQKVYFTHIKYSNTVYNETEKIALNMLKTKNITLVTGIANPTHLVTYLKNKDLNFEHLNFKDHHNFTVDEIISLSKKEFILTTEKDYMRLKDELHNVYYLPIEAAFLNDNVVFDKQIKSFIKTKRS